MIPASNIGKHNYNTLGNHLVGETHASRMKRVNAAQMQPMGLTSAVPDPGVVMDAAVYGVGGGFLGAIATEVLVPSVDKKSRTIGAAVGSAVGMGASYFANIKNNNQNEGFGSDPVVENGFFRVAALGTLLMVATTTSVVGGLDWQGMKRINPWTIKNLGTLAGAGIAGTGLALAAGASANTMTALTIGGGAALGGAYLAHQLGEAVVG